MKSSPLPFSLLFASITELASAQVQWSWAHSGVGEGYDQANTVATDPTGNVIMAGYYTSDSIGFGGFTLQNYAPGDDDLCVVKYDASGNVLWARSAGGVFDDKATALATDGDGNVYMTGYFYSPTIIFGTDTLTNAGNVGDVCVVKYDPAGNVLWAKREGGPALEIPYAIAVDDAHNIIVAGRFSSNSLTIGTTTLLQAGSMDVFVFKYDAAGNVLWATGAGGGTNDEAYALAVDANGDIIVAGYFTQHATFGTFELPNPGLPNIFLAKCDGGTGAFQWANTVGSAGDERALAIDLDAQDNIYVAGFFSSDSLVFGSTTLHSTATDNGFIARFNSEGEPVWAQGLNGDSRARGLVVANNAVYVCGDFHEEPMSFGPDVLQLAGTGDLFVLKSDLDGNDQWMVQQTSGGESGENATAIATDATGHLVMAGYFDSDEVAFGAAQLINSNGFDMCVLRMGDADVGIANRAVAEPGLLYPNPATDRVSIRGCSGALCRATDMTGRAVLSRSLLSDHEAIDLTGWAKGSYLVAVQHGEHVARVRLIVQ